MKFDNYIMTDYFSRRNKYHAEYSGNEEVSIPLRARIKSVFSTYVDYAGDSYGMSDPWSVEPESISYAVTQEFPGKTYEQIIRGGSFHEVLTVVEIFIDLTKSIEYRRREGARVAIIKALDLSGSVYGLNDGRIFLKIPSDVAANTDAVKEILAPFPQWNAVFFEAVGDLVGRRAKPEDVVKNIFVATEGYLKEITLKSQFSTAVEALHTRGVINREQKAILEKLYAYRSDAAGAGHAGNSVTPDESNAMWYLETIVAQIRQIDRKLKSTGETKK